MNLRLSAAGADKDASVFFNGKNARPEQGWDAAFLKPGEEKATPAPFHIRGKLGTHFHNGDVMPAFHRIVRGLATHTAAAEDQERFPGRSAGQKAFGRERPAAPAAVGNDRHTAGCQNDDVGRQGGNLFRASLRVQMKADAGAPDSCSEHIPEQGIAFLEGRFVGNVQQAAQAILFFKQRDLMTAPGRGNRRLHSGWPASDNDDTASHVRGKVGKQLFTSRAGIDGAPDGIALFQAPYAHGVAAEAGRDVGAVLVLRFGYPLRVRDQGAANAHHIRHAFAHNGFGHFRGDDPPGRHNRDSSADMAAYGGHALYQPAFGNTGRRNGPLVAFAHCRRKTDDVDAVFDQRGADELVLLKIQAAGHLFVQAEADANGIVRPHFLAHGPEQFQRKAQPSFGRTSIGVRTVIGHGRKKLGDEVAVRSMQFDEIHACFHRTADGLNMDIDLMPDLGGGHDQIGIVVRETRNDGDQPFAAACPFG